MMNTKSVPTIARPPDKSNIANPTPPRLIWLCIMISKQTKKSTISMINAKTKIGI